MTDHELEHLIWLALQYEGYLPPMTIETVEYWENKQPSDVPENVQKMLDSRLARMLAKIKSE